MGVVPVADTESDRRAESVRRCTGQFEFICEHGHHVTSSTQPNMETCPARVYGDGEPVLRGDGGGPCGQPIEARVIDYEPLLIDGTGCAQ